MKRKGDILERLVSNSGIDLYNLSGEFRILSKVNVEAEYTDQTGKDPFVTDCVVE